MELTEDNILNSSEAIKFRHNSDTLKILGAGVIVYGFWSVIKVVTYVILGVPLFTSEDLKNIEEVPVDFIMGILAVMLAGDVIVRLIIGICSVVEGRNHDKRAPGFYLVFAVWEILFGIFSVIAVIYQFLTLEDDTFIEVYVSFFMELTSLAILVEVYIAALSVRRYKKRLAKKQKEQKACS